MSSLKHPIYTDKAECQDCYKCLRECPLKAIRVRDHSATIIPELCVACGHCVDVCPVGAKKVRSDLERAQRLVKSGRKVIASLAPSYVAEFDGVSQEQMIHAFRMLGFFGVSETALGAEEVSAHVARLTEQEGASKLFISSACPAVVDLVRTFYPEQAPALTALDSPIVAHCRMLKKEYGEEVAVVFVSPCIAKKREADRLPEVLDVAITFEDLKHWFDEAGLSLRSLKGVAEDQFIPREARDGRAYPIDGGMAESIRAASGRGPQDGKVRFMSFSGMSAVRSALNGLDASLLSNPVFLELLACEGGCINGPKAGRRMATVVKREEVLANLTKAKAATAEAREPSLEIVQEYRSSAVQKKEFSEGDIQVAMASIGKFNRKDELNCGGCGYDSCRAFAQALLEDKAEIPMCVSYMRKMASNQAHALMKAMPSGVVLVDEKLTIIESNARFVEIIGGDIKLVHEACPGLKGVLLEKTVPFHLMFRNVLESGQSIEKRLRYEDKILKVSVFVIEEGRIVGGIVQDITQPAGQREQVVKKAREVIHNNLATVQKIAYLLGENAAESEVILNSIIDSFTVETSGTGHK